MIDTTQSLNLAVSYHQNGRFADAERLYRAILTQDPNHADAWHLLGLLAHQCGKSQFGADLIARAIALRADIPVYYSNQGAVLTGLGRYAEAEAALRRVFVLDPDHFGARNSLASLLARQERFAEAVDLYRQSLALNPDQPAMLADYALMQASIADWEELDRVLPALQAAVQSGAPVQPFSFLCQPSDPATQLACGRNWSRKIAQAAAPLRASIAWPDRPVGNGKLRIGYLSSDFKEHATTWLIADLFERHDSTRFESHAFALNPDDASAVRRRIAASCSAFHEMAAIGPAEAARAIAAAGIDILVDLKGYTADARPEVLALRPAPVQMTWIGFPGTTGADFIDYALVDGIVVPHGHEAFFSEKLIRLPGCYQLNDSRRPLPPAEADRARFGLPEGVMVFCCLNNGYKITRPIFSAWMRILHQVPDSVLWLLESSPTLSDALRKAASGSGIAAERLIFAPRTAPAEHIARLAAADLFLDTSPVNAHTTASDALWAGLPLITLVGETFVSRVAASLLAAVGLPDLAVEDLAHYEALAVALSLDQERRSRLRRHLNDVRSSAVLFDSARFVRNLERAYEAVWNRHLAGAAPEDIDLHDGEEKAA
jgi:protein O-GlcNAc transferase